LGSGVLVSGVGLQCLSVVEKKVEGIGGPSDGGGMAGGGGGGGTMSCAIRKGEIGGRWWSVGGRCGSRRPGWWRPVSLCLGITSQGWRTFHTLSSKPVLELNTIPSVPKECRFHFSRNNFD
jgi:hypothetical protein